MKRPWTDEEIGFIQDRPDWTAPRLAEELSRTPGSVRQARHKLRHALPIGPSLRFPWTDFEDSALIDLSPDAPAASALDQLPGRTGEAAQKRRRSLGLSVQAAPGRRSFDIGTRPLVARSCFDCGLLLAGTWFTFRAKREGIHGQWSSRCRSCMSLAAKESTDRDRKRKQAHNRRSTEKFQQITAARATRRGEPYTSSDYELLGDKTLTDFQKALRLERTFLAVKSARQKSGIKSTPDGLGDPERDVWVIDNPNQISDLETAS